MTSLSVLYLEDSEHDVEIVRKLFEEEKVEIELHHVRTKDEFIESVSACKPDIILADFHLPAIDGHEALAIARNKCQDIPFIILSGVMGEELAIEILKSGATDYVLKNRMGRLIPAVRRALLEARERANRIHAEKTKQKYDFIFNASKSMFTLVDRNYRYEAVNDAFCRAHNLIREEVIGKSLIDIWGEDIFEKYIKHNFEQSFSDNVVRYQAWFKIPTQGLRCFEVTFYPYKELNSDVTHTVVDTMDITDRQKAEEALRDSEAKYRMLFDSANEAILLVRNNRIETCNARTIAFFKEKKHNIINHSLLNFSPEIQPDGIPSAEKLETFTAIVSEGESHQFEWTFIRSDNSLLDTEISLTSFQLNNERFYHFFIHDLTEKKKAEARQRLLSIALEQSGDMVMVTDTDGILEYVNPAYLAVIGYTHGEIIGQSYFMLLSDEHPEEFFLQISKVLRSGETWRGKVTLRKKDGQKVELNSSTSPIRNSRGDIIHYVTVQEDITEENRIQNFLQRAQRMETVGTLAGGIAHDFNNILATILGHTNMALQDLPPNHNAYHDLEQIKKAADRAHGLVEQILTFSRQVEHKLQPVDLLSHLNEAIKLLSASIPNQIRIERDFEVEYPPIKADPSQIHQVIMNICTNAIYAMRETGGTLSIRLLCYLPDAELLQKYPQLTEPRYLRVEFEDTGVGIDQDILDRIFEPFYTTKPVGEGTGLGLSVVHGIMKSIQGEILVESSPGKGSIFSLLFPIVPTNKNIDLD